MTREQARQFIAAFVKMREEAPEELALQVPNLYPTWKEDCEYEVGNRVLYNEVLYKVLQPHTSQSIWTPDAAPSLFARILVSESGEPLEWVQPDSTNPYNKGDKVLHNGKTWVSTIDSNVWEPGVYGWEEI